MAGLKPSRFNTSLVSPQTDETSLFPVLSSGLASEQQFAPLFACRKRRLDQRDVLDAVLLRVMLQAHHADPDAFFGMRTAAQIAVRLPIRWIKLERGTFHRSVDSR